MLAYLAFLMDSCLRKYSSTDSLAENRLHISRSICCFQHTAHVAAAGTSNDWELWRRCMRRVGHELCGLPHPAQQFGRQITRRLLCSISVLFPLLLLLPANSAVLRFCRRRHEKPPQRNHQNPPLRPCRRAFPAPGVCAAPLTCPAGCRAVRVFFFFWSNAAQNSVRPSQS